MRKLTKDEYLQAPKAFNSGNKYASIYTELDHLNLGEAIYLEKMEIPAKGSITSLVHQYFKHKNSKKRFSSSAAKEGGIYLVRIN
jgi:hypothetical protein